MESGTAETATILPRLPQSLAVQLFAGATPHHLKAGEALFMVGGSGDGCYRLEQGLLKVVITSPRGDNRLQAGRDLPPAPRAAMTHETSGPWTQSNPGICLHRQRAMRG